MQKSLGSFGTLLVLGLGMGLLHNTAMPAGSAGLLPSVATSQQLVEEISGDKVPPTPNCGKANCAEKDLLDTIASSSGEEGPGDHTSLVQEFKSLANGENDFAVAIVPDPVHTHLSLFFDRTLDAIQQGAQQAGWTFDRATMPWDSQEHPESTDFHIRSQQKSYQDDKEDWPGLMIFRPANSQEPNSQEQRLETSLFVFVVGETPTGGINKKQFNTAVMLIKNSAKVEKTLRIIGPTFSGSLYSLARLLKHQSPEGRFNNVVIRSGTVSSWDTTQWFKKQKFDAPLVVDFATFQQSDRYMLRKFVEFEKKRGYAPERIAVLAEDETAYGSFRKQKPCPNEGSSDQSSETSDEALEADEDCVLRLYFPRDISQLRSAYQQGLEQKTSPSESYKIRSTLPLNFQDTGSDDDTVPQYAHSETPLSQESILLGIIATIRERHIQFVVLQATNPMDTLFLSAFLKKGYSETRVVAMPADLLLSRDADDVSLLHGVMALTTYSLLPGIDEEVARPNDGQVFTRADHIFPNAYAAGTYNATISQVMCFHFPPSSVPIPTPGCDVTQPLADLPVALYTEYGWPAAGGLRHPSKPLAPVVWLTVLGRYGFWPLAVLDGSDKAGNIESSPRPIHSDMPPHYHGFSPPWPVLWRIVCGFVVILVALYLLLLRKGSIGASFSAMTLLAPVKDPRRSALIAILSWLFLTTLLLLAWPWVAWETLSLWPKIFAIVAVIAVVLLLCLTSALELMRREATRAAKILITGSAVLVVGFVFVFANGSHSQHSFLYRYVHLTSGVSPLLPLLCLLAAGLWWAWFSLSGLALVDKRRPQLPNDGDLPTVAPPEHTAAAVTHLMPLSEKSAEPLVHVAYPAARDSRVYGPAVALLVITLFSLDRFHPLLSLETRHFEWIYTIALVGLTFALFCTLFRLLVIWLECCKILTTLDHFPLRRAFGELRFTWEPIWRFGGGRWQDLYRLISRQMETLEHLKNAIQMDKAVSAKVLFRSIEATARQQDELYRQYAILTAPDCKDSNAKEPKLSDYLMNNYQLLQKSIAYTCAAALTYLQPKWWDQEGLIVCEIGLGAEGKVSNGDGKSADDLALPMSTRLAERFVALVYLNFILTILLRMRTLAITAGGLYIFLLLSVNSYPFEPKTALQSLAIVILVFVVGMVGYVFAQMHRDSILSLVTQTNPGELGMVFWVRMGTFVALPLLSLLVSQFPALNNALFSWLQPAVNALK